MDVGEVSKLLSTSWFQYAESVAQYENFVFPIPYIPEISVIDFVGSVSVAFFLRSVIDYKIHWFRLLAVTWLLCVGGTTLLALFIGNRPRWLLFPSIPNGIIAGYIAMFHCPRDIFYRILKSRIASSPLFAPLPVVLRSVGFALGISSFGIERILEAHVAGRWAGNASWQTLMIVGVIAGTGGGLLAEWWNVLLLPKQQYQSPRAGASGAVVQALLLSFLYIFVFRRPFSTGDVLPATPFYFDNKREAVAALSVVALIVALFFRDFSAFVQNLSSLLPGWKNVLIPTEMSEDTKVTEKGVVSASDIFGYEPLVDTDRETFVGTTEFLEMTLLSDEEGDSDFTPTEDEEEDIAETEGEETESEEDEEEEVAPVKVPTPKKPATPAPQPTVTPRRIVPTPVSKPASVKKPVTPESESEAETEEEKESPVRPARRARQSKAAPAAKPTPAAAATRTRRRAAK